MGPLMQFRLAVFTVAKPIIRYVLLEIYTKRFDDCSIGNFGARDALTFFDAGAGVPAAVFDSDSGSGSGCFKRRTTSLRTFVAF
ncbi:hypothetical protein Plhal703r1_c66g0169501 [Plasmopara halstedii]